MFSRYVVVGIANTSVHYTIYFCLVYAAVSQSVSNLVAFLVAVTFSYLINAKFTFKATYKPLQYLGYVIFMSVLSFSIGWAGDKLNLPPIIALVLFSAISLFIGYRFSKYLFQRNVSC